MGKRAHPPNILTWCRRATAPLAGVLRRLGPVTPAKAALAAGVLAALGLLAVLLWPAGDGEQPAPMAQRTHLPDPVIGSSQQALELVLGNLRRQGSLQPNEPPDLIVEEMLYREAVDRARALGVELSVRPDNYECPGGCPYPGEYADSRGWFLVVRQLPGRPPIAPASAYLYWISEDGGMTIAGIR
jgi:hypothetical protein